MLVLQPVAQTCRPQQLMQGAVVLLLLLASDAMLMPTHQLLQRVQAACPGCSCRSNQEPKQYSLAVAVLQPYLR
jgi:hypothetical protein